MGHSFIGVGENKLRVRDAMLGLICAILVKEFHDLPQESSMYSVLQPFRNLIEENAYYAGHSVAIDLEPFVRNKNELNGMVSFLDMVISKLHSFGANLPSDYAAALPYGEFFQKETWQVSSIIEHLAELKKILLHSFEKLPGN